MRNVSKCMACGFNALEVRNAKGKEFPYKHYSRLILKVDLDLMTCLNCGNTPMDGNDIKNLDAALEASITPSAILYQSQDGLCYEQGCNNRLGDRRSRCKPCQAKRNKYFKKAYYIKKGWDTSKLDKE